MPLYRISGPDGRLYEIEGPAGASREQVVDAVQFKMSQQQQAQRAPLSVEPPAPKEGFFPSLKEGAIGVTQSSIRGAAAPFQSDEAIRANYAAQQAAAEQRNVGYTPFSAVPEAFEKEGLGSAIGTAYKATRDAAGRSLPYVAPVLAGSATGARLGAPLGPVGAGVGALIGGIAGGIPQFAGSNIERRIEEKTPGPLVTPEVYTTATGQAALNEAALMLTLGTGVVARVVGRPAAQVSEQQLVRTAERSLTGTLGRGAVRGAVAEMPTEVAQQILERRQAGLDLTSPDAYREYGEAAAAAGVLGGTLGGVGNVVTRGDARSKLEQEQNYRDAEIAKINKERARIADIASTAQASEQARLRAEDEALKAREADLRKPLKNQLELELPVQTSIEEVAAQRAASQPLGDLFTPPAPIEFPTLDETTLTSLVPTLGKNAGVYKRLSKLGAIDTEEKLDSIYSELKKLKDNHPVNEVKLKEIEDAVTQQKAETPITQPELGGIEPSVPTDGVSGRGLDSVQESNQPIGGGLAAAEPPVSEPAVRTVGSDTAVEAQATLTPEAPQSTEVVQPTEEPVDHTVEAKQVAKELKALDPAHPMIDTLKDELAVTPEDVAAARQEVQALRSTVAPKAQDEALQAKADEAAQAATEELPTVDERAAEPDVDEEAFNQATDLLGAYVRQKIGNVQNITPEEQISTAQALAALADIMYHLVRKGARSAGQAIIQARRALGENAKYVKPEEYQAAYQTAVSRNEATPTPKEPISKSPDLSATQELTGDNIFRDLVSSRVADARLDLGAAVRNITPKLLSMFQLVDQFGTSLPSLRNYAEINNKMTMDQQRLKHKSNTVLSEWGNFAFSNPVQHKRLSKLMVDATRSRIHPDEDFKSEQNAHLTDEMADKYKELSDTYNSLSPEAKQIYQDAKALLQENYQMRRTIYNNMVRDAYADELAEATPEEAAKINDRINKAIQEHETLINEIRGPYFPLMRFGEYLVIAESDKLRELRDQLANANREDRKVLINRLRMMEQEDEHYQVYAFEKRSQQNKEAMRLKSQGMNVRESKSEEYMNSLRANSFASIDQLEKIFDREIDLDIDPKDKRQLRQSMIDSVLAGLPENSALQRQIKRRNIAGATENMLQAFAESMERDSFYLSRMGHMKALSKSLIDMRNESKNDMQLRDVYNNVRARMNMDVKYDNHPILSKLTGFSSIYHLGIAPSYLLSNMSQPFAITLPQLAGRYGAAKASKAIISAWSDATKAVKGGRNGKFFSLKDADLSKVFSGNELKMIENLQDLGKLDIANNIDTEVYTKGTSPKMIKFWNVFNWASHNIELTNRLTTALAAYKLELAKSGNDAAASKAAVDAIELTQLDYSDTNAAYFMKQGHMGGLNRIPMQFRKYQQGMLYLLARNFKNAWGGDTEAKKAFFYLMGTQLLMAGVRGVPVVAPILFLMGAFGDKDDPKGDLETQLRNALADSVGPETARVFWKGLPAMMGVDSGSLSMENLFSPFPMMRANAITDAATGKDAVSEFMFNLGGAPVSMASKIMDSYLLASEGDYQKALEKSLPKFMSSLIKAERLGSEGLTTRSGNVAVEASEFSAWDQAIKALGFSPTKESEYYSAMIQKETISAAIEDRRNKLIKAIATARMNGEDVSDLLEQTREFNSEHPTRPINGQSIRNSIAQRTRDRAERDQTGVKFTRRERDLKEITRFAE